MKPILPRGKLAPTILPRQTQPDFRSIFNAKDDQPDEPETDSDDDDFDDDDFDDDLEWPGEVDD